MHKKFLSRLDPRKGVAAGIDPADPGPYGENVIESEQYISDLEQTLSDDDQTAADQSQAAADADDSSSISDQLSSDSDKAAAHRDQELANREHERDSPGTPADVSHKRSTEERVRSEMAREATTTKRQISVLRRASAGVDRDEAARVRDQVADARDKAAAARDEREAYEDELVRQRLGPEDSRLEAALVLAQELRDRSALMRKIASEDRVRAAADRRTAAEERRVARAELQSAQMDTLTGAYMRDLGYLTLENEIVRSRRSEEHFVVAFLDVDDLKHFNDERGHDAGDELLTKIVEVLRHELRAYDPVVRIGGDEFVCGLVATDMATARKRVSDIRVAIDDAAASSVTIGLAELSPDDSLDALISRADADMYRLKPGNGA